MACNQTRFRISLWPSVDLYMVFFELLLWLGIIYYYCVSFIYNFYSYFIENDVCYLVLAEKNYSKRLAFSYLEDLAQEFHTQYGKKVNTVTRPYGFIEFGKKWELNFKIFKTNLCLTYVTKFSNLVCAQFFRNIHSEGQKSVHRFTSSSQSISS